MVRKSKLSDKGLCTSNGDLLNADSLSVKFPEFKGKSISKANFQFMNSSKKRTNEFVLTTMRSVFFRFSKEVVDTKKPFRNYLIFNMD